MVTPDVHAVCVLHPADDDAARLERVDAAADRQARERTARAQQIRLGDGSCLYCRSADAGVCLAVPRCGS